MSATLLVVCGAPGAGKTTAVESATSGLLRAPMPRDEYPPREALIDESGAVRVVELGVRRPPFSGADTLSMSVVGRAEEYLAALPEAPRVVVADGARLSNRRFLAAGVALGMTVVLVYVDNPDAGRWRARRAEEMGSAGQSESWARGRATAARNLASSPPDGVEVVTVSGPGAAADEIRNIIESG